MIDFAHSLRLASWHAPVLSWAEAIALAFILLFAPATGRASGPVAAVAGASGITRGENFAEVGHGPVLGVTNESSPAPVGVRAPASLFFYEASPRGDTRENSNCRLMGVSSLVEEARRV